MGGRLGFDPYSALLIFEAVKTSGTRQPQQFVMGLHNFDYLILNWSNSKYSALVRIGQCGVSCHALPSADCIKASAGVGVHRRQHVPQPAGGLSSSRS
jgi:hypothetical protein